MNRAPRAGPTLRATVSGAPGAGCRVRVPATTANLGPGFDCLGMALDLWNDLSSPLRATA